MIRFGPAGNETSFYDQGYKNTFEAMEWLKNMGLNAYEYQCGRGVNIKEEAANRIGEHAKRFGIALSLHAPYFINMATVEPRKTKELLYAYEKFIYCRKADGSSKGVCPSRFFHG